MNTNELELKIINLKLEKPHLSHRQIAYELGCLKSSVTYYLKNKEQRYESNKIRRDRCPKRQYNCHPYTYKCGDFNKRRHTNCPPQETKVTTEEAKNKFGENPKCYLTGRDINIYDRKSYHFDHIVPTAKGGTNTVDNLEIATKEANFAKRDMSLDEFISMCKDILINQGYKVEKTKISGQL